METILSEPKATRQLDLFIPERWPKKPYCSDDKSAKWIRQLKTAIKQPYIQANSPHLRVWMLFDIDRPDGAYRWYDVNLLPPTWNSVKRSNGHSHMAYGICAPVLVDSPDMRQKPLRYLCAIEAGFMERLGADRDYSGLMTKNPIHPDWDTLTYGGLDLLLYDLDYLAEWVDLSKFIPKRGKNPELIGLGRNVTLFENLRYWAYRNIRHYKGEVKNFIYWKAEAYERALSMNGDFPKPLDGRECYHVAKSVSRWTWNKFDIAASDARFSKLQAHRGRQGGLAKGAANEDKRVSARLMRAKGMTQAAIAAELGVNQSTIARWVADL